MNPDRSGCRPTIVGNINPTNQLLCLAKSRLQLLDQSRGHCSAGFARANDDDASVVAQPEGLVAHQQPRLLELKRALDQALRLNCRNSGSEDRFGIKSQSRAAGLGVSGHFVFK